MEIKDLVTNKEFTEAAGKVETIEEAVELCAAYGVEVSGEELIDAIKSSQEEELSEEELSDVSGGGFVAGVYALGFVFGMSPLGALVLCGGAICGGVAIAMLTK